jgi:fructose-1,6-bisphosphatase/inositol monophosphatase family enzyme
VTDEPDDLALASNLVRAAGALAADMRRSGVQSSRKTSVTDLVTPADHAAEALIVNGLRAARPDDGIVAEEGSSQPGRRTWFVDPIDGTYNYATGVTLWCSAVGLTDAAEPLLGAVYHPAAHELWSGGPGRPTTRNGELVSPIANRPLVEAAVASYLHPTTMPDDSVREPLLRALRAPARYAPTAQVRRVGVVADGRLGGFLQHDCLPGTGCPARLSWPGW